MTDKNGSGWGRKIFRWALTSPVTLVLGALMLYYGFRAYVLEADPWRSKAIMIGLAVLWALWLVFKNLIKFLLLAAVAAAVFYGYYRYENRNEIACREQGRSLGRGKRRLRGQNRLDGKTGGVVETVCRRERG